MRVARGASFFPWNQFLPSIVIATIWKHRDNDDIAPIKLTPPSGCGGHKHKISASTVALNLPPCKKSSFATSTNQAS
jgi:hypothetical protein